MNENAKPFDFDLQIARGIVALHADLNVKQGVAALKHDNAPVQVGSLLWQRLTVERFARFDENVRAEPVAYTNHDWDSDQRIDGRREL